MECFSWSWENNIFLCSLGLTGSKKGPKWVCVFVLSTSRDSSTGHDLDGYGDTSKLLAMYGLFKITFLV